MDEQIRRLQRDAATDPDAESHLKETLKRIGRQALNYTGPEPPPPKPLYIRTVDKPLIQADPWVWGVKRYAKHVKRRAQRRVDKNICRTWLDDGAWG